MEENPIFLTITGEDIKPQTFSLKELSRLLTTVENLIESQILQALPKSQKDQIKISLRGIQEGSVCIQLEGNPKENIDSSIATISRAMNSKTYEELSNSTITYISDLISFTKQNNCAISFERRNGKIEKLVEINQETKISEVKQIYGITTIYGSVLRVGGKEPKVQVCTSDNEVINCDATREIATELAKHLYKWVGITGVASWRQRDWTLASFKIQEITGYQTHTINESLHAIGEQLNPYWKDIADPDEYIDDLRREDDR